ncbi:MAG TPA: hypothetical protein VLL08_18265 [Kineosporiaceae bacterium]|nr:hypothetical protein [Kineosporiaceae bacterium]
MSDQASTVPKVARVRYGGRVLSLAPGEDLSFGRGTACDIRLPQDDYISRRAGLLRGLEDCLLVRNDSASKPFVLRPPAGEDRLVEPGAATTSLPFQRFQVVLAGRGGVGVSLNIDVLGPQTSPERAPDSDADADGVTVTQPIELTGAQRRVLIELCEPMITRQGLHAVPATYAEIGESLSLSPRYVRNVLKGLRETLDGYGVPDLISDDPTRPGEDFRLALARWALRSGWVTLDDVSSTP